MTKNDEWQYRFRTDRPYDRDAVVLMVVRERLRDNFWDQEYLTQDGWVPYVPYAVMSNMIEMSGLDIHREQTVVRDVMKQVEEAVRAKGEVDG